MRLVHVLILMPKIKTTYKFTLNYIAGKTWLVKSEVKMLPGLGKIYHGMFKGKVATSLHPGMYLISGWGRYFTVGCVVYPIFGRKIRWTCPSVYGHGWRERGIVRAVREWDWRMGFVCGIAPVMAKMKFSIGFITSLLIGYWLTMNLLQILFIRHTVNEATRQ